MQLKNLLPAALAATASAQSLTEALASQNASLSSLNSLLATQPSLVQTLGSASNITILAPNNAAIAQFLQSAGAAAADPGAVAALLTYHVLNGTYPASAFTNSPQFLPTLLNNATYANVTGGQRVEAVSNGTSVNIISGLLQKSTVVTANINFTGGVIHIIDHVLTIPQSASATALAADLISLAGALTNTTLVRTVDGLRDVTIFAPSNSAFQAIGSAVGTLSTEQLSSILTYHVVQGTVGYSSVLSNTTLKTVNGADLTIRFVNGSIFVNSAKVIAANVLVAGGVVHVIDSVLNPNNTAAEPNPTTTSAAFSGASSASNVPFTSGITAATTIPASNTARPTSSSSTGAAAGSMPTGAIGFGALLGGAIVFAAGL